MDNVSHEQLVDRVYHALKERHDLEHGFVPTENVVLPQQVPAGFAESNDGSLTNLARNLRLCGDTINVLQSNGFRTAKRISKLSLDHLYESIPNFGDRFALREHIFGTFENKYPATSTPSHLKIQADNNGSRGCASGIFAAVPNPRSVRCLVEKPPVQILVGPIVRQI